MKRTFFFLLLALSAFALHASGSAQASRTSHPATLIKTDSLIVVKGVIKDAEDGEPVIGADVYVRGTDPDKRVSGVNHTRTNLDGEFELRVAPGNMLVTECIGYLSDTSKVEPNMVVRLERDWEMLNEVVLCAQFLYVASGVVMDAEDRTLLPDAAIFIRENVSEKTKTDEKGKFRLLYPPKDGAMLEIELPGYLPYTCKAAPNLIVLLEPDPMAPEYDWTPTQNKTDSLIVVKGVVKDAEDGTPIIGACVYVQGTDLGKAAVRDVNYSVTNRNGEFSLRVAPGALLVTECFVYLPITCKAEPDMVIELKRDLDALEDAIKTLSMYDVRTLCH